MKSLVVYSSQSGNTRKLAEAVLDALSGEKALYPIDEAPDPSGYGFIAVGFWLMGGKPDPKSSEYLGKIGKNELFIFATHTSTRREVISMPGFDGSGPAGGGPMTGGGRGYCSAGGSYRLGRSWSRRSVGSGFGRGRGYRHMLWETGLPLGREGGRIGPARAVGHTIHRKMKPECLKRKLRHSKRIWTPLNVV